MEAKLGKVPADRRKKKNSKYCQYSSVQQGSQWFSNQPVNAGNNGVCRPVRQLRPGERDYRKNDGVSVSNTQQYRVTDSYGKQSEAVVNESRTPSPLQPDNVLYMLGIRSQPFI
ncbi:hypothetical protein ACFSPU_11425 [Haoranjiania flava]|uniref:Uncharacterized protein n=1 Tax=Haoranjiania flava TaxID=1856322 RepID=A0AAE3ILW0_9BACT|nr:hypothetical protein [Haoranjiania flava]MCU7693578.1 hypothetical protein [Haoranjiania flava]